jgi:hypothetical protein
MSLDLLDLEEEMLNMDGYDDCIMGIGVRCGSENILAYDVDKVLKKLMSQDMTYEEAYEYMEFNMIGAYVGERTPIFIFNK